MLRYKIFTAIVFYIMSWVAALFCPLCCRGTCCLSFQGTCEQSLDVGGLYRNDGRIRPRETSIFVRQSHGWGREDTAVSKQVGNRTERLISVLLIY
jgi:hypothetical protein